LTKARTTYKPVKVKSYAHYTIVDWAEVQRLAEKSNVPPHWIVLASVKFATREGTKLEFMNRLDNLIEEVRLEMGLPAVQKGTLKETRLISRFERNLIKCPVCKAGCTELHIQKFHPHEYKEWKKTHSPLEVYAR
jgi:hypothetical protein